MTNPLLDLSIAVTFVCVALLGFVVVMPRPKPEPPPATAEKEEERACDPAKEACRVAVKRRLEPMTEKEKIDADISAVRKDLAEIKETIKLQQALKALPKE